MKLVLLLFLYKNVHILNITRNISIYLDSRRNIWQLLFVLLFIFLLFYFSNFTCIMFFSWTWKYMCVPVGHSDSNLDKDSSKYIYASSQYFLVLLYRLSY